MIKLTPKPNYKYLRISDNTVCEGEVCLGIYDKIENYKLITDAEAAAIKKKQLEEEEEEMKKAELEAMKAEEEEMKKAKEEALKAKEELKQAKPQSMLRQINGGKKSW